MKNIIQASSALVALFAAGSAMAADLGGSMKDGEYVAPMPEIIRGGAGPCYARADAGYSWAQSPDIKWPVNSDTYEGYFIGNDPNGAWVQTGYTSTFVTDTVSGANRDSGAFGEVGMGCGQGSRGLRGEVMFGFRGSSKVDGEPGNYDINYVVNPDPNLAGPTPGHPGDPTGPIDDPLHTSIHSYTMMLNVYKDLGKFGRVTPYVGAGIGAAYHMVDETYFTGNYNLPARIHGDNDLSFAWSLMAGVGMQVSDRAILDFGYRYIDMGEADL